MPRQEATTPADQPRAFNIEEMFRHAIDKGGGPEVMTTLMNVRRELNAEAAKKAFDTAMASFQADCPVIIKEKGVPDRNNKIAYKFAPLEAIEIQIKAYEQKYGFSHKFPTCGAEPGWVTATCLVTHDCGHSEPATVRYPIGTKTAIMSDTQQYAAAETFCKRRALCNAYGLTIMGEDVDGATGKVRPVGPSSLQPSDLSVKELAIELWNLLKGEMAKQKDWIKTNWNAHNQWLYKYEILDGAVPESAPDLSVEKFKTTIAKTKAKLKELGL